MKTLTPLTFDLRPVPPFRLDLTAWALKRRPENQIDRWEDGIYRRAIYINKAVIGISVRQIQPPHRPQLEVRVSTRARFSGMRDFIVPALTRMLGLQFDMQPFYRLARKDAALGPLADKFRGLKPPRLPSTFEALLNAIACQQLSLTVGLILLNRLAENCRSGNEPDLLPFPRPQDILRMSPGQLRTFGFSRQKSRAIRGVAAGIEQGTLDPEAFEDLDDAGAIKRLKGLRGIGRWSAEYVLLRGLGRMTMFPGDDVGARNNLARWLKLRKPLDYEGVARRVKHWQPYAGLVYFHLLLAQLANRGYVEPSGKR